VDTLEVILDNFKELKSDIKEFRMDARATTEAIKSFGVRLTQVEERHVAHQNLCEERFGGKMHRITARLKELGGIVDGQEISQITSVATLQAELNLKETRRRRMKWVLGALIWLIGPTIPLVIHLTTRVN